MTRILALWWEIITLTLVANSVVFGFLALETWPAFALVAGFLPGVLLGIAVAVRSRSPVLSGLLATIGAVLASFSWWTIYPVVLAGVVVLGGIASGKFSSPRLAEPRVHRGTS